MKVKCSLVKHIPSLSSCREKAQLSEEIKSKQELILTRKTEVEGLQAEAETKVAQRERLEKERAEAQLKLEELDKEKGRVDGEIAELKHKCDEEQKEVCVCVCVCVMRECMSQYLRCIQCHTLLDLVFVQ